MSGILSSLVKGLTFETNGRAIRPESEAGRSDAPPGSWSHDRTRYCWLMNVFTYDGSNRNWALGAVSFVP